MVVYVEYQLDLNLTIETVTVDRRDFLRLELKMSLGVMSYILQQSPVLTLYVLIFSEVT